MILRIKLVIEKDGPDIYWGRVNYEKHLLIESATTEEDVKKKLQQLLWDLKGLPTDSYEFDIYYEGEEEANLPRGVIIYFPLSVSLSRGFVFQDV